MNTRAHLLTLAITLVSLGLITRLVRRHQLRVKYLILWISVGVALTLLAASPALLNTVSSWVGIYYPPATFFLGADALLFFIAIHFSWELSRLEEQSRTLAEEIAILRLLFEENHRNRPTNRTPPDENVSG